ncbi:MAG: carboxypeptidase-like regulatory domain-containing protein, partial [Candidatus Cryptobacteroides sp.]
MRNILTSLLLVFLGLLQANAFSLKAPDDDFAIHGIVKDEITRRPIAYVNVYLVGSEIGTVTNEDGVFSLKLKDSDAGRKLEIYCMGYASGRVEVPDKANASKGLTVFLKPVSHLLNEAKIFGGDAKAIVLEALGLVRENYPLQQNLLTMFYRETITKGSRYAGISEGMMEVNKRSYARRNVRGDKVRILKGRKLLSQKTGDTLAVKIQGGPHLAVDFDFVKNADMLFDEQSVDYYIYEYDSFIMLDDRIQYVIKFKPCVTVDYPLYT